MAKFDELPRGEAFEALVRMGRERVPSYAIAIDAAAARLSAVLASGDGSRIPDGSKALADWIDARLGAAVYAHLYGR